MNTSDKLTASSTLTQVMQLSMLSMPDIKALWEKLYDNKAPTHNRKFLERRLAYRIQEIECRKSNSVLFKENERKIQALMGIDKQCKTNKAPKPMPGSILTRYYHDKEYRVTVTADQQYEFEGRLYSSLSKIAREITGTRWSGPLFFGLKKKEGASKK